MLLLPHHWLGFALLAVLISPACAVPVRRPQQAPGPLISYKVTVVNEEGNKRESISPRTCTNIDHLIGAIMKDLGDGPSWQRDVECDPKPIKKEPYHPGEMAYFEFTGPETKQTRKCYGYVIITPTHSDQHTTTTTTTTMQIGAVITKTGENLFTVVDQLPTAQHTRNISKKTHRQKFDKFLGDFKPIAQWSDTIKAWKEATGEQKQAMKAAGTEVRMSEWLLEHPEGPKRPRPEDKDAAPAPDAKRLKPAPPLHPAHPPTARLLHPAIAPPYPPGAPPHSGPGSRQSLPPIRDMFHGPWSFDHQGAAGCSSGSNSCQPPRQQ